MGVNTQNPDMFQICIKLKLYEFINKSQSNLNLYFCATSKMVE